LSGLAGIGVSLIAADLRRLGCKRREYCARFSTAGSWATFCSEVSDCSGVPLIALLAREARVEGAVNKSMGLFPTRGFRGAEFRCRKTFRFRDVAREADVLPAT